MPVTATTRYVYNQDIRGLASRINRFIVEMMSAASANLAAVNEFDQARLQKYIDAIRTYQSWVLAQPQMDLPETSPRQYPLDPDPTIPTVENEAIRDVIVMLELARDELINSQSARHPTGMLGFDANRLGRVIDKVEAFLTTYIAVVQPLDLPESSPAQDMGPAGKSGV
jgi:hypothetical protein